MNINFIVYDLAFMVVFTLAVVLFISRNKKNLKKESFINLYRTKLGLKLMDSSAKKFSGFLHYLQYFIIVLGYFMMVVAFATLIYIVYTYLKHPEIVQLVKAPPIMPLVPYFGEIFGVQSFFPSSLSFTYFLLALAVVAIVHEFSHGLFARLHKVKIHSSGFAFAGPLIYSLFEAFNTKPKRFPKVPLILTSIIILAAILNKSWMPLIFLIFPLLGAFVEQDDKQMNKTKKVPQLGILAAGAFANILFALIFLILMWLFFIIAFAPAGVVFSNYAFDAVPRGDIVSVNGMPPNQGLISLNLSEEYVALQTNNITYFAQPAPLKRSFESNVSYLLVYRDSPAFRAKLSGAITHVDGVPVSSFAELGIILSQHKPGDTIEITTLSRGAVVHTPITLAANNLGKALLGITVPDPSKAATLAGVMYALTPKLDNALTGIHYESKLGEFGKFIFYMLWWIMTINFFVAPFNMLPCSILDGGRFFYITVLGLTGSEKIATRAFKVITWIIVALLAIMMVRWAFSII